MMNILAKIIIGTHIYQVNMCPYIVPTSKQKVKPKNIFKISKNLTIFKNSTFIEFFIKKRKFFFFNFYKNKR